MSGSPPDGRVGADVATSAKTDTVFVVVRLAGERMPAAVLRLRASELPADVVIDDRHGLTLNVNAQAR